MRRSLLATALLLALLAAAPADAQRFGQPLPGITITGPTAPLSVEAGGSATTSFHVAYQGTGPIDVQFAAREVGGFGFGGGRNGTRPDGVRFNGTRPDGSPAFNGTRPSFPPGGFGRGRRTMNLTATTDPTQVTLQAIDEGDVTVTIQVAATAASGDHAMVFFVRSGNQTAMQAFTVHVNGSASHASPAASVAAVVALLGVAAVSRRRR